MRCFTSVYSNDLLLDQYILTLRLWFLPYAVFLVGRRELLLGKLQLSVLSALEGGSGVAQASRMRSLSCVARWLSPSHTADELTPPAVSHRHCKTTTRSFYTCKIWNIYTTEVADNRQPEVIEWSVESFNCFDDKTYSLIVSLQLVQTRQSIGRVVDRKWDFWFVLLTTGAERGPGCVTSIIRRRFMTH